MNTMLDEQANVPAEIEAVLNYTRNTGARPVDYTFKSTPGRATRQR